MEILFRWYFIISSKSNKELYSSIKNFNNSNPEDAKNIIESNTIYRGNQHDLDTFNNTIQYIEYKKNLRKNKKTTKVNTNETYNNLEELHKTIEESQYKKKWSRLDNYCKKQKISEYIEKEVKDGELEQSSMKDCIAYLYRLLEQRKLNKKGNIEYDSDNGQIISISDKLYKLEIYPNF